MQMGMEAELLIPGVEHGGAADSQAAVPGFGGDGAQGLATVLNRMSKTTLRLPKAIAAISFGRVKTTWK